MGIGNLIKSGLKFKQYMRLFLLFLLTSCATLPVEKECAAPGEIQFSIWDDECKDRSTNLVSYWNGCRYELWQIDSPDDWVYVGRFKNLDTLGEFIKVTRPFAASRSISYREVKRKAPEKTRN